MKELFDKADPNSQNARPRRQSEAAILDVSRH
jgi:hypothetical protein